MYDTLERVIPTFALSGQKSLFYPQTLVSFDPNGAKLATYSKNLGIIVYNCPSLTEILKIHPAADNVFDMTWDPPGRHLATACSAGIIKIYDTIANSITKVLKLPEDNHSSVFAIKFHPNLNILAAGGTDSRLKMWCTLFSSIKREMFGHLGAIHSVDFSSNGRQLLSASHDGTIRIWTTDAGCLIQCLPVGEVSFAQFAIRQGQILVGKYQHVQLWDYERNEILRNFGVQCKKRSDVPPRFTTILKIYLIIASDDSKIYVWDIRNFSLVNSIKTHDCPLLAMASSNSGVFTATSGMDGSLRLWRNTFM